MDDEEAFPELEQADRQLTHICLEHLTRALVQIEIGLDELDTIIDDERHDEFHQRLTRLMDELIDFLHRIYDTIPGMISREEAEEMLKGITTQNIAWLFQDNEGESN